jgi:DNA-binding MarR family transcriptional regulator
MAQVSLWEFSDKINEIMPIIAKEFVKRQAGEFYKMRITLPQFLILMLLHKEVEVKMSELAHFMSVTTAATTGIVDRLVRDDYLVRTYDPQDRRIIKVKLTTKGSQLVKKINQQKRRMIVKVFGRMPESDRENYLRILMKIKDMLLEEEPVKK